MTTVVGSVASAFLTCASAGAMTAVGPLAYLTVVLIVQATSSAVIGCPSDHFVPDLRWNVQSFPSLDVSQESARSPTITYSPFSKSSWTGRGGEKKKAV